MIFQFSNFRILNHSADIIQTQLFNHLAMLLNHSKFYMSKESRFKMKKNEMSQNVKHSKNMVENQSNKELVKYFTMQVNDKLPMSGLLLKVY